MNLLLLPGFSKRNKEWIKQVESSLAPLFERTHRHSYKHWENDESDMDLDDEIDRVGESLQDLAPYAIFAKSIGTIVTCKASAKGVLKPKTCLFVGFPLAMVTNQGLPVAEWLQKTNFPITVLQHTTDPLGGYQEIKQFFETTGRGNVTVRELPGDTHDYLEFEQFKQALQQML